MIYISTSSVKSKSVLDSIAELNQAGFKNIELSGGSEYIENLPEKLIHLKEKLGLNYLLHNYFPPPKNHFVLNLASVNNDIFNKSLKHLINAINLSKDLDADKFGFHAGFLLDPGVEQLGQKFSKKSLVDKKTGLKIFYEGVRTLKNNAGDLKIYIENNVFSSSNHESFGVNPFLLTSSIDYFKMREVIDFNLLLDVGHLKVSCKTLNLDFSKELELLWGSTNYVHLSDNDGLHDTNESFDKNSDLFYKFKELGIKDKTISLEIYSGLDEVRKSYEALNLL